MTPEERKEIEERANAATPCPWEAGVGWVFTDPIYEDDRRLANVFGMKYFDPERTEAERERAQRNAEFVSHAREDVPALLTEVKRLRGEVDKWWKATNDTGEALAKINRERGAAQDRANAAEAANARVRGYAEQLAKSDDPAHADHGRALLGVLDGGGEGR